MLVLWSFVVGSVRWVSGDLVWFIGSAFTTADELLARSAQLLKSTGL